MNSFDDRITQALSAEDQELLARHAEPGYVAQAFGLFRGPWAWVMWLVNVVGGLAFLAALYAFWRMAASADALAAVQWGVAALALFQFTTLGKLFLGSHLETNRVLREVKRVELQLALLQRALGEAHKP